MLRAIKDFLIIVGLIIAGLAGIAAYLNFSDSNSSQGVAAASSAPIESASSGMPYGLANVAESETQSATVQPSGPQDQVCTDPDTMTPAPDVWVQNSPSASSRRDMECDDSYLLAFAVGGVPHLVLEVPNDQTCNNVNGSIHTFAVDGQPMQFVNYCFQGNLISEPYSNADRTRFVSAAINDSILSLTLLGGSHEHFRVDGTRDVLTHINQVAIQQVVSSQTQPWSQ